MDEKQIEKMMNDIIAEKEARIKFRSVIDSAIIEDGRYKTKRGFCLANEQNTFNLCVNPGQILDVVKERGLCKITFPKTKIEWTITHAYFDRYIRRCIEKE